LIREYWIASTTRLDHHQIYKDDDPKWSANVELVNDIHPGLIDEGLEDIFIAMERE